MDKINWLEVFENIDINKRPTYKAHIVSNQKDKIEYYNSASFSVTYQYIWNFKRETELFSNERKLNYIETIIKPLQEPKTEDPIFNQVIYNAECFYLDFLKTYMKYLKGDVIDFENQPNPIKSAIELHFRAMDKDGWEYSFFNKDDYYSFIGLLTNYFTGVPYELPANPIRLKRGSKSKIGETLGSIQKELSEKTLKSDIEFLNIVKVLNSFIDKDYTYICKVLQK
jgi:hypothetical protein